MPLTLSKLSQSQKTFIDVPCPGESEAFRIHRLGVMDFLALRPLLQEVSETADVDSDGTADLEEVIDKLGGKITPIISKSLGGDWDSPEGVEYLEKRVDLLGPLFHALVKLHTGDEGEVNPEEEVKND